MRTGTGKSSDYVGLAADCVAFANASGGRLLIGIEDGQSQPPAEQRIDRALIDVLRKRVGELTVNVEVQPERRTAANGGEFIALHVARSTGTASTSDGRYYQRVGDQSRPVLGDEVLRLATERPQVPWEVLTGLAVPRESADVRQRDRLLADLRASARVKASVKEKADEEMLEHYGLVAGPHLTNLGVLLVGRAADRARLGSAPVIQAIRYDERRVKVEKFVWDDNSLSPVQIVDAIWVAVPDFRERYELPDGMLRVVIPAYEEVVVRELLVNALVHRPYTQRGDIFLNLHPDRLEVVNPGRLPLGVNPANILHTSRRRNDGLARVFHDLGLMEREGSGLDTIYERLLATGRGAPEVSEEIDSVQVSVPRRVVHAGVMGLITEADQRYQLTQRERITLGLLAQTEGLTAIELAERLSLADASQNRTWLGRLPDLGLVAQDGRTRSTRYFVPPELLRASGLDERTTLSRVQPHRLRALILEDLERYPDSSRSDIHRRVGPEIPDSQFRRRFKAMVDTGEVLKSGENRWRTYRAASSIEHDGGDDR